VGLPPFCLASGNKSCESEASRLKCFLIREDFIHEGFHTYAGGHEFFEGPPGTVIPEIFDDHKIGDDG